MRFEKGASATTQTLKLRNRWGQLNTSRSRLEYEITRRNNRTDNHHPGNWDNFLVYYLEIQKGKNRFWRILEQIRRTPSLCRIAFYCRNCSHLSMANLNKTQKKKYEDDWLSGTLKNKIECGDLPNSWQHSVYCIDPSKLFSLTKLLARETRTRQ